MTQEAFISTSADHDSAPDIATQGLSLAYGNVSVIEELELRLPGGQVTAIVGPNGCGKSTLLSGMSRLLKPRAGTVLLDGADIQRLPSRQLAKRLALLPQQPHAPEALTVAELVRFGRHPHQSWLRQWSPEDKRGVDEALELTGLTTLAERPVDALSGGQRQRAWIAMAIAQQTSTLLLDEPTSALDLGHQVEVYELIRSLTTTGKTIVMVIHDLIGACRYADHLIAMHQGRILAEGPPHETVTTDLVRRLYGVDCTLMTDPATGAPLLTNVRRTRDALDGSAT
ncbi:iron complex transport system ATP-binding protein [Chromohalobacter marismortui]|uniref:Iron complex transport system ATP-binding protein n=3 Tax=Chromohalobacter TaxID=42054 RepID=A0A4R7NLI1_9GAMM|nr:MULTISPECIES: ABC transporter ATP-binding protein [Chromohalobacter]MCI0510186.1 ABC transporter ATP-binding protein [Chromohalobacter sp.]TDU21603.1 iron complex transport system ATP-binding protein [Chromohalobacter marismortui]